MVARVLQALMILSLAAAGCVPNAFGQPALPDWMQTGQLKWKSTAPLISLTKLAGDEQEVALKDPSIVRYQDKWHLFVTRRLSSGKVNMQYLRFDDWKTADHAERFVLDFMPRYHCAPQVFYFRPHNKWYLLYQASAPWDHPDSNLPEHVTLAPVVSTTADIFQPDTWSAPERMLVPHPLNRDKPRWIDFWIICDDAKAHLFFTSDDGYFFRSETKLDQFPQGWTQPEVVLHDQKNELFEASHTYRLAGTQQYLTIIEAIGNNCRYYKAWLADRLEGPWRPIAAKSDHPFAAAYQNVEQAATWTTSVSHGELLRSGYDETLTIPTAPLQFLFQGVDDRQLTGTKYGSIPWRLGLLEQVAP